jgi:cadaverine:lysine antiporter
MIALAGAEGTTLTATFIMSLVILMFYSKKAGLTQYVEQHANDSAAPVSH